jgi:hypothetical protein
MKLAAVAVAFAVVGGCGSGAAAVMPVCTGFSLQEFNESGSCVGPPVTPDVLQVCTDANQAQGHGVFAVCLIGPDGGIYRSWISSTAWIEGTGWTHSAYAGVASTLAAADEPRCANVLPLDRFSTPACP